MGEFFKGWRVRGRKHDEEIPPPPPRRQIPWIVDDKVPLYKREYLHDDKAEDNWKLGMLFNLNIPDSWKITPDDWDYWLNYAKEWTPQQAALICLGIKPHSFKDCPESETIREYIPNIIGTLGNEPKSPGTWIKVLAENNLDGLIPHTVKRLANMAAAKELTAETQIETMPAKPEPTTQTEAQAPAISDKGEALPIVPVINDADKPRKKLTPIERGTTTSLLLIYEITSYYSVEFLDKLKPILAWAKIIEGDFKSELINDISEDKKSIVLAGGEKLDKQDFLEKYRGRFK